MENITKCPFCGKDYEEFTVNILGTERIKHSPTCDCMEKKENERQEKELKFKRQEKQRKLFNNSMMTPYFKEKTFEKVNKTQTFLKGLEYANKFKPHCKGIQAIGNIGTGKTTLMACICNQLMNKGYSCLFTTMSALLDRFISACSFDNKTSIESLYKWISTFDFVVLDDIGRESYTDKRKEIVFRIIDTLLNHQVTFCITANPNMLAKLNGIDEWEAVLDRIKEVCGIYYEFKGNSLRGVQC